MTTSKILGRPFFYHISTYEKIIYSVRQRTGNVFVLNVNVRHIKMIC